MNMIARIDNLRKRLVPKLGLWFVLLLLTLPTVLSLAVFSYFPKFDAIIHAFYRWQPPIVEEIVGLRNFHEAFADPAFWQSFRLVGLLLIANLVKMIPGIIVAIALHRLLSNRLRYIFQVLFVIPMIIPGMVWLLIWKNFYEPDFGLLNRFLNATGLMTLLRELDEVMPKLAGLLNPVIELGIEPVFQSTAGLIFWGVVIYLLSKLRRDLIDPQSSHLLIFAGSFLPFLIATVPLGVWTSLFVYGGISIVWMRFLALKAGSLWIIWPFIVGAGTLVFLEALWILPVVMVTASLAVEGIIRYRPLYANWVSGLGFWMIVSGALLVVLGQIWVEPVNQFMDGNPAWLGSQDLVIPAILFWGFPWVGTVSVLIYLSGLQNIPQDVYEAADLDGLGAMGKILYIEIPLIMTQIRINLIFMTIGTLNTYEMFLILLGPEGGPGGKGMVPGLYMFQSAFVEGRFGYACALGMILFVILLTLTIIYQRFVRVEK